MDNEIQGSATQQANSKATAEPESKARKKEASATSSIIRSILMIAGFVLSARKAEGVILPGLTWACAVAAFANLALDVRILIRKRRK